MALGGARAPASGANSATTERLAADAGGAEMGTYAVNAAQATLAYARTLWPSMTYANIGVTPMIGQNDDPAEVFTEADAHTLVSFAQSSHLGRLAFWSVDRDQPGGAGLHQDLHRPQGMTRWGTSRK